MTGYSPGSSGSQEQLRFVVDIVAGDQSGIAFLDQLQARVLQLDQTIKSQGKSAKESFEAFTQAGQATASSLHGQLPSTLAEISSGFRTARESAQTFTQQGLHGALPAVNSLSTGVKSAAESFGVFEQNTLAGNRSLHGTLPALTGVNTGFNNARASAQAFAQQGLGPLAEGFDRNNRGISMWLVNASNVYGIFSNLQGAAANLNPAFQLLGQSVQEIGFGFAGIAQGGMAGWLGAANIAASLFKTFTDLGKASGDFYNEMRTGAAVMGMTEQQTYTLRTAMELSGANVQQLQIFIQRLTKAQEDLASGTDNVASRALKRLDVAVVDSNGALRSSYDLLIDVQGALAGMSNEQERNALTAELAGMRSREVNALMRDFNVTVPQAQELLRTHGDLFVDLEQKQNEYNLEMAKMKLDWYELSTAVGPTYISFLQTANTTMDIATGTLSALGSAAGNLGFSFSNAVLGMIPFRRELQNLIWFAEKLNVFSASRAEAPGYLGGNPFGTDDTDAALPRVMPGATTVIDPNRKRTTQPWELDSSESGSAAYNVDKFSSAASKGPATGYSGLMAQQLALPAARAAFDEFTKMALPKEFVLQANGGKAAIQAWTMANKEWDEVLQKVRLEQYRTKIAITDLRLAGDHTSQTFLDMQARLQGLTEAEDYLNMKRHEAMDGYATDIETLRQTMSNARQVTRALIIDVQGPTSVRGRSQLAYDEAGPNYMQRHANPQGAGGVTFVNNGVVTTNDLDRWFSDRFVRLQRTGRTQVSGT